MQLFKTDSVSRKPEEPAPIPGPPNAPPVSSSSSSLIKATPPTRKDALPPSVSQPPQTAPAAEAEQGVKEQGLPLADGAGGKEQYGYIVTNQRSAVGTIQHREFLISQKIESTAVCMYKSGSVRVICFLCCSHLSLYDGVKLLELLADKIHLTTSSFINIR